MTPHLSGTLIIPSPRCPKALITVVTGLLESPNQESML